jgi:FixJ family two-component response regulator
MQIAVVDDESGMRIALKRFLRGHGFDVVTFGSGKEFLDWLGCTDLIAPFWMYICRG